MSLSILYIRFFSKHNVHLPLLKKSKSNIACKSPVSLTYSPNAIYENEDKSNEPAN